MENTVLFFLSSDLSVFSFEQLIVISVTFKLEVLIISSLSSAWKVIIQAAEAKEIGCQAKPKHDMNEKSEAGHRQTVADFILG